MKNLLLCTLLLSSLVVIARSQTVEPHVALKAAIEKSAPVWVDHGQFMEIFSDFKVEAQPCSMKLHYQIEYRDEETDSTDKFMSEIKWADVQYVRPGGKKEKYYMDLSMDLDRKSKLFKTSKLTGGKYVETDPKQTVVIPLFHKGSNGYIDPAAFAPNAALVNALVQKCGGGK